MGGMHIVVTGNPVDGFDFIGPFTTAEDAVNWATQAATLGGDWWVAPLLAQEAIQ